MPTAFQSLSNFQTSSSAVCVAFHVYFVSPHLWVLYLRMSKWPALNIM
jgi:hypothetical protein